MRQLILTLCFVFISFAAHAETIYLQIPVLDNNPIYLATAFAADYKATTGEGWVMHNMEEKTGVVQMMGSSRITEAQAIELKSRWPMMNYHVQIDKELPPGWQFKPSIMDE